MSRPPMRSVPEVAAQLGTSERHVREMIATRRIPFLKVGGKVRFRQTDLDAWLDANTTEAAR